MLARNGVAPRVPRRAPAPLQAPPRQPPPRPTCASSRERRSGGVEQIQPAAIHLYADARTDPHVGKSSQARDERLPADIQVHERFTAQGLDDEDVPVPDSLIDRAQSHVLRADPELQFSLVRRKLNPDRQTTRFDDPSLFPRSSSPSPSPSPSRSE